MLVLLYVPPSHLDNGEEKIRHVCYIPLFEEKATLQLGESHVSLLSIDA